MSSVIKSNILKKSEVTVLTYLIMLDLIKLTILIKPVFHNAMWNGINYVPVLWFFIDCLTAVFPWVSGTTHSLWPVPTCFSSTSKYCPHLRFYQSYTFSHFQSFFLKSLRVFGASPIPVISCCWMPIRLILLMFHFVLGIYHLSEHMDVFFMTN